MALDLPEYHGGPNVEFTLAARISRRIFQLKQACQDRFITPDSASLEVVFEYPGTISRPKFVGIRPGRHSRRQMRTQLWVAVPERLLNSAEFADFYFESLEAALQQGKRKFDSTGIPFPLEQYQALVREMAKRYREQNTEVS